MLVRRSLVFVAVAVVLAGCSDAPQPPVQRPSDSSLPTESSAPKLSRRDVPADLLVFGSQAGVTVLDPATGSPRFTGDGVPSLGDWSMLFTATPSGRSTVLRGYRATTGENLWTMRIRGDLAIRVVSAHGGKVALMAPESPGRSTRIHPRDFTDIVVADPTDSREPRRFHLRGNFEPEAFSTDGTSLFLIRYLPPTAPASYQVARLDLAEGKVRPVLGRRKTPVETMSGTRLEQLASPEGTRLYTLYTSQPPAYAKGHDAVQARAGQPVAFIHTLSLDGGWAVCIGLPKAFWGGDPAVDALTLSRDGRRLYVVDAARGVVAVMDTVELTVLRTAKVPFERARRPSGKATGATVLPDAKALFVADGRRVVVVDSATLRLKWIWGMFGPISRMAFSSDGRVLYALLRDEVEVLNPSSGQRIRMIPIPGTEGVEFMGTLTP
ncbi:MAG TPA: hypothetical protein VEQ37_09990 [Actinomycetota bacterium]|nr:hypothetical protein [Actinomycetota bacterium]